MGSRHYETRRYKRSSTRNGSLAPQSHDPGIFIGSRFPSADYPIATSANTTDLRERERGKKTTHKNALLTGIKDNQAHYITIAQQPHAISTSTETEFLADVRSALHKAMQRASKSFNESRERIVNVSIIQFIVPQDSQNRFTPYGFASYLGAGNPFASVKKEAATKTIIAAHESALNNDILYGCTL